MIRYFACCKLATTAADGDGCFTMSDLYNFRGEGSNGKSNGPVYVLDTDGYVVESPNSFTGKWLLTSELFVTGGGKETDPEYHMHVV